MQPTHDVSLLNTHDTHTLLSRHTLQPLAVRLLQPVWEQSGTKVTPERMHNAVDKFSESLWKVCVKARVGHVRMQLHGICSCVHLTMPAYRTQLHAVNMMKALKAHRNCNECLN